MAKSEAIARRTKLSVARSWAYQLRISDLAPLAASTADVLVIDNGYAARHLGKSTFGASDVGLLKTGPDGHRRIVLAYLSIGEAEQYRFYWRPDWCHRATAPRWMGSVNPNWPGNYPVRFWDAGWQDVILNPVDGYLAKIKAQGFDGIYLDRSDVYSEWLKERPRAEADMIGFLRAIATAARVDHPDFLVVMQNAEELLRHAKVRQLIDGVAKEDLLYGIKFSDTPNKPDDVAASVADLRRATADGIPVFSVEYLADPVKIAAARKRLAKLGFVPTFAPRLLDRLSGDEAPPPKLASVAETGASEAAAASQSLPGAPEWAEGGPTCLVD